MRADPATLEQKLNYRFSRPELLRRALVHSSLANDVRTANGIPLSDNEQLEFLGDSILGFLVSEALVQRGPEAPEGQLSSRKSHLVSAAHLHGIARRLDLGSFLELGRGEEISGGRTKKNLLADAVEALIAALYLDGGIGPARDFVVAHVLDAPFDGDFEAGTDIQPAIANFKSALQEFTRSKKLPMPRYTVTREQGPEHAKTFTVEVRIGKDWSGHADGRTKKVAAQRAARAVYEKIVAADGAEVIA